MQSRKGIRCSHTQGIHIGIQIYKFMDGLSDVYSQQHTKRVHSLHQRHLVLNTEIALHARPETEIKKNVSAKYIRNKNVYFKLKQMTTENYIVENNKRKVCKI